MKKIYPFWIKKINVGHKKILALYFLNFLILCIWFEIGLILFFLQTIIISYFVLFYGINFILDTIETKNEKKEVVFYFLPTNQAKNRKFLKVKKTNFLSSKIYLNNHKKWAYFPILENIIEKTLNNNFHSALILGGGGAAFPYQLINKYPEIKIDVVEKEKKIIKIAKKWFIDDYVSKINFIQSDACTFVTKTKNKYDFTFVDLFINAQPPKIIMNSKFIFQLKQIVNQQGLIFINFGSYKTNDLELDLAIKKYQQIFPQINIYLWRTTIFGIAHQNKLKKIKNTVKII